MLFCVFYIIISKSVDFLIRPPDEPFMEYNLITNLYTVSVYQSLIFIIKGKLKL